MVTAYLLNSYFWYATLGVYSLFFLYIIMVILAQKTYYPYVYLYVIISFALLSNILNVINIGVALFSSPIRSAATVFLNLTFSLTWLFLYEPSRQINNLRCAVYDFHTQSTSPTNDGRVSPWKLSQYTSTGVGIVILSGYFLAFLLVLLHIVMIIILYVSVVQGYGTSSSVIALPYIVVFAPWLYVLMWLFLAASHWRDIEHKASYLAYGVLAFCIQLGITLIDSPYDIFYESGNAYAPVIIDFVLIRLAHFAAIFVGIIYGSRWAPPTYYDAVTNPK